MICIATKPKNSTTIWDANSEDGGERWSDSELCRIKGEIPRAKGSRNEGEAEACLHQAVAVAAAQQAKSFELRAATSLARLWRDQGKRQGALDLLAPIFDWFSEGFDTPDLKEAKLLLDELSK